MVYVLLSNNKERPESAGNSTSSTESTVGGTPSASQGQTGEVLNTTTASGHTSVVTGEETGGSTTVSSPAGNAGVGTSVSNGTGTASSAHGSASSSPTASENGVAAGVVNIRDYGAVGNGKADDTAAFLRALQSAKRQNLPLYLPSGSYRLTSTIELTSQTVLGLNTDNWPADAGKLPTILLDHASTGFSASNAAICGVHITYQTVPKSHSAILIRGTGTRVSNVKISNAYSGILFAEAGNTNPGRSNIENVTMENIQHIGLYVSGTLDVPYVGNVSVSGSSAAFRSSGIAFKLAQNDDIRMIDCVATGAYIGYQFEDLSNAGTANVTPSTWGSLLDCTARDVDIGIRVVSGKPSVMMQPITLNRLTIQAKTHALQVENSRMQMTLVNSTLTASSGSAVLLKGGDGLIFFNNVIRSQGTADAVRIQKTGNAIFNSCKITAANGCGIVIDNAAHKGISVIDNTITATGTDIVNRAPASVKIAISGNG